MKCNETGVEVPDEYDWSLHEYMNTRNQQLLNELLAMREIGLAVTDGALNHARLDDLSQYDSMTIEELASLFAELYYVKGWKNPE